MSTDRQGDPQADQDPTITTGLSIAEAADQLGISENAVRQRIKRGTIPAVKVGGVWAITLVDQEADRQPTSGRDPQAGYQERPSGGYEATRSDVVVSDAARAQLEAIRDEWLRPFAERNEELARQLGRVEAERDQLRAELEQVRAERAAEDTGRGPQQPRGAPRGNYMAPDPLHPTEVTLGLRVRRWLRRITGESDR